MNVSCVCMYEREGERRGKEERGKERKERGREEYVGALRYQGAYREVRG